MKKTTTLCFMGVLPVFTLFAAENENNQWYDAISENSFFSQTKLDLSTRNYWKYLKEDEAQPTAVHQAWGQSFTLNYQSGYFADFIGFDATYNNVIKLGASDYFSTRGLLYNDGPGMNKDYAHGFNKFSQRYVKIKMHYDDLLFDAKAGWQILKNFGVLTASNRLTQNSYLGYTGILNYRNVTLNMGYVTSSINRDAPDKTQFTSIDRNSVVDHIFTSELKYTSANLKASYAYGEADNYMRRHIILLAYKPVEKLTLGSQLYGSYALTNYLAMPESRKEFNHHAWHYAFDAKWQEQKWSSTLGIAYTQAPKDNAIGFYKREMTRNMRGTFVSLTSAGSDYTRDGEIALTTVTDYRFTDDFTAGIQVNYGQFHYKNNTLHNGELNLFGQWKPNDARLKNLSVFAMFGPGWSYKNINKTPTLDNNGRTQRSPSLSGEIVIEYKFGLLK
ncbi:OprD family outer membrane porin [Utexia brackfieldae]|uniref:OprD family outer membrane porin n=1 Tax=Utexia brackfieldae TaxID=3074108 RepID=UPI00370D6E15